MGIVYDVPVLSFTSSTNPSFADLANNALFVGIQTGYGKYGYLYLCASESGTKAAFYDNGSGDYIGLTFNNDISYNSLQIYVFYGTEYGARDFEVCQASTVNQSLASNYSTATSYVLNVELFDSRESAIAALYEASEYPITYRLTNCSIDSAPTKAAVGDTVTVQLSFTSGYGIVNPSSDVYVTNNGVLVPSTYADGTLTFIMPDPS